MTGHTTAWGETLRKLRQQKGWSMKTLSEKSGVSAVAIWRVETERSGINMWTLTRLLDTLGFHIEIKRNGG